MRFIFRRGRPFALLAVVVSALCVGVAASGSVRALDARASAHSVRCAPSRATSSASVSSICAASNQAQLVWQGRIQLGGHPGIFSDASYSGLTMELPMTLEQEPVSGPDRTTLILDTQNVTTFAGYPGDLITVFINEPDHSKPFHSKEQVLTRARLTSADHNQKKITVNLAGFAPPWCISLQIREDTTVPPGLINNFVVTRLSNISKNFRVIADLGYSDACVNS